MAAPTGAPFSRDVPSTLAPPARVLSFAGFVMRDPAPSHASLASAKSAGIRFAPVVYRGGEVAGGGGHDGDGPTGGGMRGGWAAGQCRPTHGANPGNKGVRTRRRLDYSGVHREAETVVVSEEVRTAAAIRIARGTSTA
jgi:hypothetical protein